MPETIQPGCAEVSIRRAGRDKPLEQLRRNPAALCGFAMKDLDHLAGKFGPRRPFGWKTTCMALSAMSASISYDS